MGLFNFIWNTSKSTWNLMKRHRRKFYLASVLAVVYFTYQAYKRRRSLDTNELREVEQSRKRHHLESNQRTAREMFTNLLMSIKQRIDDNFNVTELTELLKTKGSEVDKMKIWEELKVISFAKSICFLYSAALLHSFCSVVVNILGGYMYLEKFGISGDVNEGINDHSNTVNKPLKHIRVPPAVKQKYLSVVQYLLGPGLNELINVTKASSDKVVASINMKDKLNLIDIESVLNNQRQYIEQSKNGNLLGTGTTFFIHYLLPAEENTSQMDSVEQDGEVSEEKLILETYDVVESEDFKVAFSSTLNRAFALLLDNIVEFIPMSSSTNGYNVNMNEIVMAKLIPIMSGMTNKMSSSPTSLYDYLARDTSILAFNENIYECFSN